MIGATVILSALKTFGLGLIKNWKVVLVVIFSIASLWAGNEIITLRKSLKDCQNAPAKVTPREVPLPPVHGEASGQTLEPIDTSQFHRRINALLDMYRKAKEDSLNRLTELQRCQAENRSQRAMIEDLSKEKEALKTVAEGQMKVSFNPLLDFPGGRFSWDWRPNPVWAYDTTKTIPPLPFQQHLFDVYGKIEAGGLLNRKFMHDMAMAGHAGLKVNIDKWHFNAGLGAASMHDPKTNKPKGVEYYVFGLEYVPTQN